MRWTIIIPYHIYVVDRKQNAKYEKEKSQTEIVIGNIVIIIIIIIKYN